MSIEENITNVICSYCYDGDSEEEKEVIKYGLSLFIESVFKTLVIIFISIIIGKFKETIEFLIVFCAIRVNAGGIHCKTNFGCTTTLLIIYFASIFASSINFTSEVKFMLFIMCMTVCIIWAPSSTENNPITNKKRRILKKITCLFLIIATYLDMVFSIVHVAPGCILVTYISITFLITLQEGKRLWKKSQQLKL